jgi:hypothetical protein
MNKIRFVLLAASIMLALAFTLSCSSDDDKDSGNDYEMLNGVWDRGDIVVTFNNSNAVFTQINSNSAWQQVLDNGSIRIGDKKFRNITKTGDLKWSCQELTYYLDTYLVKDWEDCTITMSADGQTIQNYNPDLVTPSTTYTRK